MAEPATAIIVFAHGSPVEEANEMIARLAGEVAHHSGWPTRCAFLDVVQPDLAHAVAAAVREGARRVIVVPCFLSLGVHVRQDLPRLVAEQQAAFPEEEILAAPALEGHPGLAQMLLDRVRQVLSEASVSAAAKRMG